MFITHTVPRLSKKEAHQIRTALNGIIKNGQVQSVAMKKAISSRHLVVAQYALHVTML